MHGVREVTAVIQVYVKEIEMAKDKGETTENGPDDAETLREQYERQEAYKRARAAQDDD